MSYNDPNQPLPFPPLPPDSGPTPFPGDVVAAPRTGMASWSLGLGIAGVVTACVCVGGVLGLIGLVLGLIAIGLARSEPARYGGQGRAVTGIITGLFALLVSVAAIVFLSWTVMPLFKYGMTAEALRKGLADYHQAQGEYPPTLAALTETVKLVNPASNQPAHLPADTHYYAGLDPNDPAHWILAYVPLHVFGQSMYVVIAPNAHGEPDVLQTPEFQARRQQFLREFQAEHGHLPVVTTPSGPAEDEVLLPEEVAPASAPAP